MALQKVCCNSTILCITGTGVMSREYEMKHYGNPELLIFKDNFYFPNQKMMFAINEKNARRQSTK